MNTPAAPSRTPAFHDPAAAPGALSAAVAAALLAAVGDVSFILTADGTIRDVAVAADELAAHGFADWIGRPWIETVTVESRPKVVELLAAANAAVPAGAGAPGARWRQVNHPADGGDVPIRYLVMPLGDRGSAAGGLVAIGRDLRGAAAMQQRLLQTQQSLERDYLKLRAAETRYRLLFDTAAEPVLIVDAGTRRIREANPAAYRLLGAREGTLVGNALATLVEGDQRDDLIAQLGAAEAADEAAPVVLRLAGGRGEAAFSARLFRQARMPLLIVRVAPAAAEKTREAGEGGDGAGQAGPGDAALLAAVVERMPDAFVLVDGALNVLTANAAFVELAELPTADRVVGARLGQWLGRPGIDLELIVAQLREHGSVRNVATILRGAAGAHEEVEVSGVVAPRTIGAGAREEECYGFTIRNVGRRLRAGAAEGGAMPRSVGQLTELVGRMSLKDIVRESTDMIERLCIEAALVYTSDNRASAAEILGVSRQSLYSKLHRHGLGNLVSGDD